MKIAATTYNLEKKELEIYVSGCKIHCKNCHNPELQSFNIGTELVNYLPKLREKINDFDNMIKNIGIYGGEPFDSYGGLYHLLIFLKEFNKIVWVFTGYEKEYVKLMINEKGYNRMIQNIDYIKYGCYNEKLKCNDNIQYGISLASNNQWIDKIKA